MAVITYCTQIHNLWRGGVRFPQHIRHLDATLHKNIQSLDEKAISEALPIERYTLHIKLHMTNLRGVVVRTAGK